VTDWRPGAESKRDVLLLSALCVVLFFTGIGGNPLWDIDEGMHAAMSHEMVSSGDWLTPRLNGDAWYDKPALFSWLGAICFKLFGFTELAARLPSALAALATVLLTHALGRSLFGGRVGILAGAILATSIQFVLMARVVVHDMVFTLCLTAALVCWWHAYAGHNRRKLLLLCFYTALGLATLTKGPIGVVLVGLVIGSFLVLQRRMDFVLKMGLWWGEKGNSYPRLRGRRR